jgi:hypothetical protein
VHLQDCSQAEQQVDKGRSSHPIGLINGFDRRNQRVQGMISDPHEGEPNHTGRVALGDLITIDIARSNHHCTDRLQEGYNQGQISFLLHLSFLLHIPIAH